MQNILFVTIYRMFFQSCQDSVIKAYKDKMYDQTPVIMSRLVSLIVD